MKIGIIGTGMLGEAVGLHLLDVGYEITVFNRTKEKTENLKKNGVDYFHKNCLSKKDLSLLYKLRICSKLICILNLKYLINFFNILKS